MQRWASVNEEDDIFWDMQDSEVSEEIFLVTDSSDSCSAEGFSKLESWINIDNKSTIKFPTI